MELFRLSTDANFRKNGIAASLIEKLEETANFLKIDNIVASTSCAQEAALRFYVRNGWEMVNECHVNYAPPLDFIYSKQFRKYINFN